MTIAEAMQRIEGSRFATLTNLASNLKTFLRIAGEQAEVQALSRALTNDPALISVVFDRVLALSAVSPDGDQEHGWDAALAIYLRLLSDHRPDLAQRAAGSVQEQGHFFWARKFAENLRAAMGGANGQQGGAESETAQYNAGSGRKS